MVMMFIALHLTPIGCVERYGCITPVQFLHSTHSGIRETVIYTISQARIIDSDSYQAVVVFAIFMMAINIFAEYVSVDHNIFRFDR